jgi:hypothetical protein
MSQMTDALVKAPGGEPVSTPGWPFGPYPSGGLPYMLRATRVVSSPSRCV